MLPPPLRAVLPLVVAGLAACTSGEPTRGPAPVADGGLMSLPLARRPSRRYFLSRTGDRCNTYWVNGDEISALWPTPCPPDLQPGERMRIAGRTCMREGGGAGREEPVVCPDPLTNREKEDRRDGGF